MLHNIWVQCENDESCVIRVDQIISEKSVYFPEIIYLELEIKFVIESEFDSANRVKS